VLRRVFEQGAYTDRAFTGEAAGLEPRERAFAMQLAYGTVQRRATIDYVAGRLTRRRLSDLEPPVLAALRLGIFQLTLLGGVAEHAAVDQSVELVKHASPGGASLVNAVLRRVARQASGMLDGLSDERPADAATLHSVPEWLAQRWFDELGAEVARALLRRINAPAESALRLNTLVASPGEVLARLPVASGAAVGLAEGIVLQAPFDAHSSPLWHVGAIMPQSRASMLVSRVLAPAAGDRVLDLCAAPGAKTTHLAALMEDQGEIVAAERHPGRAQALARTCSRMHAGCVRVEVGDATKMGFTGRFDRVLVDPPCSGLGTLQSRPDIRWRASPEGIDRLSALQERILAAAASAIASGGVIVYSVCTISRPEGPGVLERFLKANPDYEAADLGAAFADWSHPDGEPHLQLLPHRDGTDGFFIGRLRRR
jgi:16S rRNA (cytosine967-C5)-methyltransferase